MDQARKIGQWVIDNGKQAKGEADHLVGLKENVVISNTNNVRYAQWIIDGKKTE